MRAFILDGYGAVAGHVRLAEIADAVPGPDEVGIQIHAASLNPIDFKIVHGDLKRVSKYRLPRPFGFDASGVVTAVGGRASKFKPGDRFMFAPRATRSVHSPSESHLAKISSRSSRLQSHTRKPLRCHSSG
jgi:NADPH:quinone reductase-like Zn-dependent oxidoreductase